MDLWLWHSTTESCQRTKGSLSRVPFTVPRKAPFWHIVYLGMWVCLKIGHPRKQVRFPLSAGILKETQPFVTIWAHSPKTYPPDAIAPAAHTRPGHRGSFGMPKAMCTPIPFDGNCLWLEPKEQIGQMMLSSKPVNPHSMTDEARDCSAVGKLIAQTYGMRSRLMPHWTVN